MRRHKSHIPVPRLRSARRAFTLIELLVVIGMIGALIGIFMPAVARVRAQSQKTVCKAQLQQIGYAFRMYTDRNNGRYPRAPALPSVNPNNLRPIQDYLATDVGDVMRVFQCPADTTVYPTAGTSYFYYAELGERALHDTLFWKVYSGDVTRIPVLWDADHYHGGTVPFNWLMLDGHVDHFLQGAQSNGSG